MSQPRAGTRGLLGQGLAGLVNNLASSGPAAAPDNVSMDSTAIANAVAAARRTVALPDSIAGAVATTPASGAPATNVTPDTGSTAGIPFVDRPLAGITLDPRIIDPRITFDPRLADLVLPVLDRDVPRGSGPRTTTNLAQSAIAILAAATPDSLRRAFNSIGDRSTPEGLLDFLERRVRYNEVIAELAEGWTVQTRQDFGQVFGFEPTNDQWPVMDNIVSLAILNDPSLEAKLRRENTAPPSSADLLENRRIVWQYPLPGTVLNPPYLVLVAVEHTDPRPAQDVVQTIMGTLVTFQGFRLPQVAQQKLV